MAEDKKKIVGLTREKKKFLGYIIKLTGKSLFFCGLILGWRHAKKKKNYGKNARKKRKRQPAAKSKPSQAKKKKIIIIIIIFFLLGLIWVD